MYMRRNYNFVDKILPISEPIALMLRRKKITYKKKKKNPGNEEEEEVKPG